MAKPFFKELAGFLAHPKNSFLEKSKTTTGEALIFGLKGYALAGLLSAIVVGILLVMAGQSTIGIIIVPIFLLLIPLIGVVGTLLLSLWLHLWAYVFGARNGLDKTIKLAFYSGTPSFVIGWIPMVSFATIFWTPILYGIGLKQLQKMSTGRAAATVIIAIVIPVILILLAAIALIAALPSLAGLSSSSIAMQNLY
ncbi:MAG: YIP1 family protein [DPANN group archaeon]|nr:YIP1 family protein [DPANN group archaeon]